MILEEIFKADMNFLGHNILKVLEVDLRSGKFLEVKVLDGEKTFPLSKDNVNDWVESFLDADQVPESEKYRVWKFFKLNDIERHLKEHPVHRIFYHRLVDCEWRYVSAEFIRMGENFDEDGFALLVIRDINDYVNDFRKQITPC